MGDLNKYLPHEALNVTSLGAQTKWDVQTRQDFDGVDTGDVTSTHHVDVTASHKICIGFNTYFFISFSESAEDINRSTSFCLPRGNYFLNVPKGVGATQYLNVLPFGDNGGSGGDEIADVQYMRLVLL